MQVLPAWAASRGMWAGNGPPRADTLDAGRGSTIKCRDGEGGCHHGGGRGDTRLREEILIILRQACRTNKEALANAG